MKPAPFAFHAPATLEEAAAILAEVAEEDGRVIAGGQSLVPMMALRLAAPAHLVDINRIPDLDRIAVEDGALVLGATARHKAVGRAAAPGPLAPLLATVERHIAHDPIRRRGTFCGSLANADPASEWCLLAVVLGADLLAVRAGESRTIPAEAFLEGPMTTALLPEEILAEARLPLLAGDAAFGLYEFARRSGDFAQAMALAVLRIADGRVAEARIGVGAVEDRPRRVAAAEAEVAGRPLNAATIGRAAEAAAADMTPVEAPDLPVPYRRDLARTSVARALGQAAAMAGAPGRTAA